MELDLFAKLHVPSILLGEVQVFREHWLKVGLSGIRGIDPTPDSTTHPSAENL